MSRFFAFLAAIMVSFVAISSATASEIGTIRFRLDAKHSRPGMVQASFSSAGNRGHDNHWSTNFTATALTGLDLNRLRAGGDKPLRFALLREAGRLDCAGNGGNSRASGTCAFTADARFINFLASRGMRRPTRNESFSMMAVDVRRETVEALHTARYPVPTPDELISLTAVGVDAGYISGLARAGYRPPNLDTLLQFKALDITPGYIAGFVRHGFATMDADQLVQLKALDINADYIASFERIGYRNLSADQLVELKALGVTAEYASAVQRRSTERLTPGRLVELKAIGFRPR
jgi:hypothetical protein